MNNLNDGTINGWAEFIYGGENITEEDIMKDMEKNGHFDEDLDIEEMARYFEFDRFNDYYEDVEEIFFTKNTPYNHKILKQEQDSASKSCTFKKCKKFGCQC